MRTGESRITLYLYIEAYATYIHERLLYQGVLGGKTIGPVISFLFSGPTSNSTRVNAKGNAVPNEVVP